MSDDSNREDAIRLLDDVLGPKRSTSEEELRRTVELIDDGALAGAFDRLRLPFVDADGDFHSALWWAASRGRHELVGAMLRAGADPNRELIVGAPGECFKETTPLMAAVISADNKRAAGPAAATSAVHLLLESGADPNLTRFGRTALHFAAQSRSSIEILKMLLGAGADPLVTDEAGETPLVGARRFNNHEAVKLLREAAAARPAPQRPKKALVVRRRKPMHDLATACGVDQFAKQHRDDYEVTFLLARAPVEEVAGVLADRWQATRWERSAQSRPVEGAEMFFAVVGLSRREWTIAVFNLLGTSEAFDDDAAALSLRLQTEAISCWLHWANVYREGEKIEQVGPSYDEEPASQKEVDDNVAAVSRWLGDRGVFVPGLVPHSDGHDIEVYVYGLRKSDVDRLDIVVVQEHADAETSGPTRATT